MSTILITGATTGLGLALARLLLERTTSVLALTGRASSLPRLDAAGLGVSERVMRLTFATPEKVARKILKVMSKRNPPLRVRATPDAYVFDMLRRLLPRPLYHRVLYRNLPGISEWGQR